ncbi:MAG: hypothetical protein ABID54_07355 [Pseudomonadota bacterium]
MSFNITDPNERTWEAWGSVSVKDRAGEIIPIEELEKTMPIYMRRGGPIMYQHGNFKAGEVTSWEVKVNPNTGKPGILLHGRNYSDYAMDDEIWKEIQNKEIKGLSFGGRNFQEGMEFDASDGWSKALRDLENWEFSWVHDPCNQEALTESINRFAKSNDPVESAIKKMTLALDVYLANRCRVEKGVVKKPMGEYKDFADCVRQNQDKDDPEAYCGYLKHRIEDKGKKKEMDVVQMLEKAAENVISKMQK